MQSTITSANSIYSIHRDRVREEMRNAGISKVGFIRLDARYLPKVIHATEHVLGLTYGHDETGPLMLVATDERIICLRKEPYFVDLDDVSYSVISGVSRSHVGFGTTVILHTRVKDFIVHTYNDKAAQRFVDYIESHCLQQINYGAYI